jgi:hypothetical protein
MLSFVDMAPYERRTDDSSTSGREGRDHDNLYHIIITQAHLKKDVNSVGENIRVCGTYTSLPAAKAAAHRTLFDGGYEQEWFTEFDVNKDQFPASMRKSGLMVYAVVPDETTFSVNLATTPNLLGLKGNKHGKVMLELYHVVQTTVDYGRVEGEEERETNIEGSFESYEAAWKFAKVVLLNKEDGITKASFADYYEAAAGERDCGFGENVIVHAVGQNGVNFLVSVVKAQEMEAVRLAEAAMQMR